MIRQATMIVMAIIVGLVSLAACAEPYGQPIGQSSGSASGLRVIAGYLVPEDTTGEAAIGNGVLTELSPVWYQPTESGAITFASKRAELSLARVTKAAEASHTALMPSISNFRGGVWDDALVRGLISDPQLRAKHIADIVDLVQAQPWAGVDIDYEALALADRAAYSAFITDLGAALHKAHKGLSVTVHAKTSEPGDWSGARAQNWKALGAAADEVRVMAYDYSSDSSPAGPVAPASWVEHVLQLAISEIPRAKITLGLATYGYDWSDGQPTKAVQWKQAQALAQTYSAAVQWDASAQESWFTYTDNQDATHSVWYEDARSMQAKLDLAQRYQISSVVIWRLGGEDPAIWKDLDAAT